MCDAHEGQALLDRAEPNGIVPAVADAFARCVPVAACLVIACATATNQRMYSGPELPPEQVVTLRRTSASNVHLIDGEEVRGWMWELQPGSHELYVSVMGQSSIAGDTITVWMPCAVRFDAKPGATYRVDPRSQEWRKGGGNPGVDKLFADVVDIKTGETASCQALNKPISYY